MIFISYGIPKSASSFVFQITRRVFELMSQSGRAKLLTPSQLIPDCPETEFAEEIIEEKFGLPRFRKSVERSAVQVQLDSLIGALEKRIEEDNIAIVLKTHLPCSPNVERAIRDGRVLASATFRHPAEMLLSMDDMAKRENIVMVDRESYYRELVNDFYSWAAIPQVRRYYYDEIAKFPEAVARDIANHVGVNEDESAILSSFMQSKNEKIWQFNQGVTERHLEEMAPKDIKYLEGYFSDFIAYIRRHKELFGLRDQLSSAGK